jgi:hypothetical protein
MAQREKIGLISICKSSYTRICSMILENPLMEVFTPSTPTQPGNH